MKKDARPWVLVLSVVLAILFGQDVANAILGPIVDTISYALSAN